MVERLDVARIPGEVRSIARHLREAGHEAWYVGGAVRDVLVEAVHGQRPARAGDFDIATSARPEEVQRLFRRTVPVGIEHGTVAVLDERGGLHEVTTFRRDVRTDGRHAVVEFGVALDEDLARRDFTINAVAVHPDTGELRDPFAGRADVASRLVRAVGDPRARMREDWLRVLRALRFAATLEFAVEPETWEAVRASAPELAHLSRERVRDEWTKAFAAARPSRVVGLWRDAGALGAVWPELAGLAVADDARLDDVTGGDPTLVTAKALFLAGATSEAADAALLRLRYSSEAIGRGRTVVTALRSGFPPADDRRAVRRWLSRRTQAASDVLATLDPPALREALGAAVAAIRESREPLTLADLALSGDDLLATGVPPGKAVGKTLRRLLDLVLDDPSLNTRETLLAVVKRGPS